jgi:hypothetical protein
MIRPARLVGKVVKNLLNAAAFSRALMSRGARPVVSPVTERNEEAAAPGTRRDVQMRISTVTVIRRNPNVKTTVVDHGLIPSTDPSAPQDGNLALPQVNAVGMIWTVLPVLGDTMFVARLETMMWMMIQIQKLPPHLLWMYQTQMSPARLLSKSLKALQRVPQEALQRVPQEALQRVPQEALQKVPQEALQRVPQEALQKVPREALQRVPPEALQEV